MVKKRNIYQENFVKEIWFVDYSNEIIEVDFLIKKKYITKKYKITEEIESKVIDGLTIKLENVNLKITN